MTATSPKAARTQSSRQPAGIARLRTGVREWRRSRAAKRRPGSRRLPVALAITLAILVVVIAALYGFLSPSSVGDEQPFDRFVEQAAAGKVRGVVLLDEDARIEGTTRTGDRFWVGYPKSDAATADLITDLVAADVRVEVDAQPRKSAVRLLLSTLLPLLVLANLFALVIVGSRSGGSGIGEVITFGTLGQKKLRRGQAHAVSFDDVAGADEAVVELREVVDYLADPTRYEALGAAPPKGVLLFGPPGCGKTLLAKAVAGEAGVPFVSVAGAEFVESLVGVGAARVRDLFARVRAVAPAIVFIDELDAAGRRRGGGEGGSEERDQTLNQLLVEMDGFEVSAGIVVMAATNRPDIIDPALLRPGRFDRHITVSLPDPEGRRRILDLHAKGKPVDAEVDFASLAHRTPGYSGADLANVVNEATLLAIRDERRTVLPHDFEEAARRVVSGPQRRGQLLTDDERLRLAHYEAGRAVVAAALGRAGDVHRVSILDRASGPRAQTAGADSDAALVSAAQLRARLAVAVAGTVSERRRFGDVSTHGESDLEAATTLARDLAGRYGMSDHLGLVRRLPSDTDAFLGGTGGLVTMSEAHLAAFDDEVARLVVEATTAAESTLLANAGLVDEVVERLATEEHLEGEPLATLLAGASATAARKPRARRAAPVSS